MNTRIRLILGFLLLAPGVMNAQDVTPSLPDLQPITVENAVRLTQLARYGDGVFTGSVAWSPDGKSLALAGSLGVWLYDVNDFDIPARLIEHDQPVIDVAFSTNGVLAFEGGDIVHVWDLAENRETAAFPGGSPIVFSPDGRVLATAGDDRVLLWDVTTGKSQRSLEIGGDTGEGIYVTVENISFSPDGRLVMASWARHEDYCTHGGINNGGHVWDLNSPDLQGQDAAGYFKFDWLEEVIALTIAPGGSIVAVRTDWETITLRDIKTGEVQRAIATTSRLSSPIFSPDGSLLAADGGGVAEVWDVRSGELVVTAQGDGVLAFSPDSKLLAVGNRIWDIATREQKAVLHKDRFRVELRGSTMWRYAADNTLRLLDTVTGSEIAILAESTDEIRGVFFSPDEKTLVLRLMNGNLRLIDPATGMERAVLPGAADGRLEIVFSGNGKFMATVKEVRYDEREVRIWDTLIGEEVKPPGEFLWIAPPYFGPDSAVLLVTRADTVRLWYPETGVEKIALESIDSNGSFDPDRLVFSPDGRLIAAASGDLIYQIWDVQEGQQLNVPKGVDINSFDFSPNGKLIAYVVGGPWASDGIRLWDLEAGKEAGHIDTSYAFFVDFWFSADGKRVEFTTQDADGECSHSDHIWDIETGREIPSDTDETPSYWPISSDGLLGIDRDGSEIVLSDTRTGNELTRLKGHNGWVSDVRFIASDKLIVSEGEDGTVRLWGVPSAG